MKQTLSLFAISTLFITSFNSHSMQIVDHKNSNKTTQIIMENENYTTSIIVEKTPTEAFNAISNFRAWWSDDIEGKTDQLGETFFYHYKDVHLCKIKLIEKIADKKLVYQVIENEFSFTKDKTEWVDTKLVFDIKKEGKHTKITFTHEGLVPSYECYEICNDAWTSYIQGSLKNLITTGQGKPNPKEGGLNAELVEKWGLPNIQSKSDTTDFSYKFESSATPNSIYTALLNVRSWWTGLHSEKIEGNTDKLNKAFTYHAGDGAHYSKQQLVTLIPDKKIVWLVTDSHLNFLKDNNEWTGTKICFEIIKQGDKTEVRFTHEGLVPQIECFEVCSSVWTHYLENLAEKLK